MSFNTKSTNTFFTILGGKFVQRVSDNYVGAIRRVNKMGREVYEIFHDSFTGLLVGIRVTDTDYGKSWNFDFVSDDKIYTLQLSYSNSFGTALLKMLPNIDVTQEFTITPSTKEVDGKNQSTMFANQNKTPIKHAYTKDAPNGMPDMEKIVVKGQEQWDDTKRIEFLEEMVNSTIIPKLPKKDAGANVPESSSAENASETDDSLDVSPEDLDI